MIAKRPVIDWGLPAYYWLFLVLQIFSYCGSYKSSLKCIIFLLSYIDAWTHTHAHKHKHKSLTWFSSLCARNRVAPSNTLAFPRNSTWLYNRATRKRLDSSSGLNVTWYWYSCHSLGKPKLNRLVTTFTGIPLDPEMNKIISWIANKKKK